MGAVCKGDVLECLSGLFENSSSIVKTRILEMLALSANCAEFISFYEPLLSQLSSWLHGADVLIQITALDILSTVPLQLSVMR